MSSLRTWSATAASAWFAVVPHAKADGLRFHGDSSAARAVTGSQQSEFGWGGSVRAGMEWAWDPRLGVIGSFHAMYLGDGSPPADTRLVNYEVGVALGAGLGLHARPWATHDTSLHDFASGLWLQGTSGVTRTGATSSVNVDLGLGWDFSLGEGSMAVGPSLGWLHVFQPDRRLRPDDANVLTLGIHGVFGKTQRQHDGRLVRRFHGIDDQKKRSIRVRVQRLEGVSLPSSIVGQRNARRLRGLGLLAQRGDPSL